MTDPNTTNVEDVVPSSEDNNSRKRKAEDISKNYLNEGENRKGQSSSNNGVHNATVGGGQQGETTKPSAVDASGVVNEFNVQSTSSEEKKENAMDDVSKATTSEAPASDATTTTAVNTTTTTTTTPLVKTTAAVVVAPSEAASVALSTTTSTNNSKDDYSSLKWIVVRNDGKAESMIKLVGLKSLFAKQLPKMPRAYIARLVLDPRHTSLAILSDKPDLKDTDEEIIGGICYRAFPEMRFAEIAFCAVNATHQVKGYGTKLMNLLKKFGAETGIQHFITYADNYAIGYFKKQGFSKSITMPKGRYFGYIKEYDGGTPMECYVHPSIDYTRIPAMLQAQRRFILNRLRLAANSSKVYDPLPQGFAESTSLEGVSRANHTAARAMAIPGIAEAGWTLADLRGATGAGKEADRQKTALKTDLLAMVRKVEEQQFAWPFREPVDTREVPDYLDVIKSPMDLQTIEKRIRQDNYYRNKDMFLADLMLIVNNCKAYNDEQSTYVQCAKKLEKFVKDKFR